MEDSRKLLTVDQLQEILDVFEENLVYQLKNQNPFRMSTLNDFKRGTRDTMRSSTRKSPFRSKLELQVEMYDYDMFYSGMDKLREYNIYNPHNNFTQVCRQHKKVQSKNMLKFFSEE